MSNARLASGGRILAICDRCRMTFQRRQLRKDGNSPGLRVCRECFDVYNPYRLPPRVADPIALPWIRPMVHLVSPIYQYAPDVVVAPSQSRGGPVMAPSQDLGHAILAEGNIAPPPNEFPLETGNENLQLNDQEERTFKP
jgi:hypothetical protein